MRYKWSEAKIEKKVKEGAVVPITYLGYTLWKEVLKGPKGWNKSK